jgi:hypothetical protein
VSGTYQPAQELQEQTAGSESVKPLRCLDFEHEFSVCGGHQEVWISLTCQLFNVTGLTKEFRCYFTGGIKIHASMLAICL